MIDMDANVAIVTCAATAIGRRAALNVAKAGTLPGKPRAIGQRA